VEGADVRDFTGLMLCTVGTVGLSVGCEFVGGSSVGFRLGEDKRNK
jgi:hypothetical protein